MSQGIMVVKSHIKVTYKYPVDICKNLELRQKRELVPITVVELISQDGKSLKVMLPIPELGIDRKELRNFILPKSHCKIIKTGKKYDKVCIPRYLVEKIASDIKEELLSGE